MDKYNKYEWIPISYKEAIDKISTNNKKIKQKEYISNGKYPVIDQGQEFIGGFTNDESKLLNCTLPALVFGDHTKIVKLVNYKFAPGADGVKVVVPRKFFNAKLFEFFTKILALKIPDKGYARHFQYIEKSKIPLPPLLEQRAIVSKIEQLFSDLDSGIDNFKKAQEQLKRYRQTVLKAACEGKLVPTEAELACAEGRDYEPADVLLARILKEGREKWNGKGKYKEPAAPDKSGLPELPEGWGWASIGQVTECLDHLRVPINKKERAKRIGDIPYYGANGQVDWIDEHIFDEPLVLIVEDETFVGREKPFCYKITGKSWVNNHAHILRANDAVNVDFLNYSLMYYPFTPLTTGTTGRRKLTKTVLMQAPYSLPPSAEQCRIVAEVECRLSLCDKMEATIAESLKKAESLRQSILKKAFEGKLLSEKELEEARNAPDWEPAEKLLERIKAEKNND